MGLRNGFLGLTFLLCLQVAKGIIGYDCGTTTANLTTLSLVDIEECTREQPKVTTSKTRIQLLQVNEFHSLRVIQCKVEIDRTIRRCGMHSHTMDVWNGKLSYVEEIKRDACREMHLYGTHQAGGTRVSGLKPNSTTSRPVILAGSIGNDGSCEGTTYSDYYGTWERVVVPASIRITLRDYFADVSLDTNRIKLRSGVHCELKTGHCVDIEGGDTFWSPLPVDGCRTNGYGLLYEGLADKTTEHGSSEAKTVFSLVTEGMVFALTEQGRHSVCGYELKRTEHPKLFIREGPMSDKVFAPAGQTSNLDLFTYVNSKFVYVEKHVRTQMNRLYADIMYQQCLVEHRTLQNALAIATTTPDVFAYYLMKGPGHMAMLAGEVIHILKCIPVEVQLRPTSECHNRLAVSRGNESYFLTPQTHVLTRQAEKVPCDTIASVMYRLGTAWYRFTPLPTNTLPPAILRPAHKPDWTYTSADNLATSGIYTQEALDQIKEHIMFPIERPAVLSAVAGGLMGQSVTLPNGTLANFLDEATLERIVKNTWSKIWRSFMFFGNLSAGALGIFVFLRGIKFVMDTALHGYALHKVYGWSLYLLGAIWDSVTNVLLHLGQKFKGPDVPPSAPDEVMVLSPADPSEPKEIDAPGRSGSGHFYPTLHLGK